MQITNEGFGAMAKLISNLADVYADGRLVACLEGGYDIDGLEGGVRATIEAQLGKAS